MEINLIIRELLAKHTYISLPNIGSFIQKYEPAHLSNDGITFIPPKQSIIFDTSRTFNDEAIENYLCDKLSIEHSKAAEILAEFLNKTKDELNSGKEILFENVGSISKDKDGTINFKQALDIELATSTYGLTEFEVTPTLSEKTDKPKPVEKQPIKPEKKTDSLKILASVTIALVIIVVVTIFILIPELRFWNNATSKSNSKVDTIVTKNITQNHPEDKSIQRTEQLTDSSLNKKDSLESKVDQTIKDKTEKKTALYYQEAKPQENKTYYLIVGSFGKIENAQKLSEKFSQKGLNPEIIQGNNMFRVSISKTKDKHIALSEFNKFHSENPNESAWILGI